MAKLKLKKKEPTETQSTKKKLSFKSTEKVEEKPKSLWDIVDHEQDFHMLYSGC